MMVQCSSLSTADAAPSHLSFSASIFLSLMNKTQRYLLTFAWGRSSPLNQREQFAVFRLRTMASERCCPSSQPLNTQLLTTPVPAGDHRPTGSQGYWVARSSAAFLFLLLPLKTTNKISDACCFSFSPSWQAVCSHLRICECCCVVSLCSISLKSADWLVAAKSIFHLLFADSIFFITSWINLLQWNTCPVSAVWDSFSAELLQLTCVCLPKQTIIFAFENYQQRWWHYFSFPMLKESRRGRKKEGVLENIAHVRCVYFLMYVTSRYRHYNHGETLI